jgi:hypothetical protein
MFSSLTVIVLFDDEAAAEYAHRACEGVFTRFLGLGH